MRGLSGEIQLGQLDEKGARALLTRGERQKVFLYVLKIVFTTEQAVLRCGGRKVVYI